MNLTHFFSSRVPALFRVAPCLFVVAVGTRFVIAQEEAPEAPSESDVVEELFPEPPSLEAELKEAVRPTSELPALPAPTAAEGATKENAGSILEEAPELPVVSGAAVVKNGEMTASGVGPSGGDSPYDLVLKDGRVLKGYQVHSWNKTTLTIFHSTGAANVPAHLLPPALVKAYGMDPTLSQTQIEKDRTTRTEQAVAALKAMDERKAMRNMPEVTVEGLVMSVADEGVILQVEDPSGIAGKGFQRIGGMIYDKAGKPVPQYRGQIFGMVWVVGHPLQGVVVDGDRLRFRGRVNGRRQVDAKTYPSIRFEKAAQ